MCITIYAIKLVHIFYGVLAVVVSCLKCVLPSMVMSIKIYKTTVFMHNTDREHFFILLAISPTIIIMIMHILARVHRKVTDIKRIVFDEMNCFFSCLSTQFLLEATSISACT